MKLPRWLLVALLFAACGRELPSSTPLGGVLDDGVSEGYTPDRKAKSTDAGREEVAEKKAPESPPSDAGVARQDAVDAGAADAGAVEAGVADAPLKWAGEYVGNDLTVTRFAGEPDRTEPDP